MNPQPTGSIVATDSGRDLVLGRDLPIPAEEAWNWASDPVKLRTWFGSWTGQAGTGGRIEVSMNAEAEPHTSEWEVAVCDPGRSFRIASIGDVSWDIEVTVEPTAGGSRLTFTQHLDEDTAPGSIAAGWEWYLDRLVAAIGDEPMPDFNDYWPALGPHYA